MHHGVVLGVELDPRGNVAATNYATNVPGVFVAFGWIPVVLKQSWAGRLVNRTPDGPNDEDAGWGYRPGERATLSVR